MCVPLNFGIARKAIVALLLVYLLGITTSANFIVSAVASTSPAGATKVKLSPRIPPPDPNKYERIQDAANWRNPYVNVFAEELEFTCLAAGTRNKRIQPTELETTLALLPVSAWPYGRVVAVSEAGVRVPSDTPHIKANVTKVTKTLESLGVAANWWPSA